MIQRHEGIMCFSILICLYISRYNASLVFSVSLVYVFILIIAIGSLCIGVSKQFYFTILSYRLTLKIQTLTDFRSFVMLVVLKGLLDQVMFFTYQYFGKCALFFLKSSQWFYYDSCCSIINEIVSHSLR